MCRQKRLKNFERAVKVIMILNDELGRLRENSQIHTFRPPSDRLENKAGNHEDDFGH
jgi:hypothetical protein